MKKIVRNKDSGITLIALVITVIVLLILAGISISMLSGDNGILQRATDAKTETERGEVYEQISLATASGEMDYYSNGTNRLTAYKNALLNGVEGIDRDNLTDNGSNLITGTVTTKSGKQYDFSVPVPVTDITLAEHDGTVYPLASTVLKVNSTGTTPAEKSPYVNYHYKDNEEDKTILCRVLYDAESEYGIQIISNDSTENIQLGINGDAYFIQNDDYNNAVSILNTKAGHYLNGTAIVESARSVGSDPNSTEISEGTTSMFTISGYKGSGQYKDKDDEYLTDMNQISLLGITTSTGHWLASRTYYLQGSYRMGVRISTSLNNGKELVRLYNTTSDEYIRYYAQSSGFRPVFHLKSGLKVISGNGTEKSPYELSL